MSNIMLGSSQNRKTKKATRQGSLLFYVAFYAQKSTPNSTQKTISIVFCISHIAKTPRFWHGVLA
ncbi:TPA: hypothetical protein ACPZFO_001695, partial [Yersinia enterocolitica]